MGELLSKGQSSTRSEGSMAAPEVPRGAASSSSTAQQKESALTEAGCQGPLPMEDDTQEESVRAVADEADLDQQPSDLPVDMAAIAAAEALTEEVERLDHSLPGWGRLRRLVASELVALRKGSAKASSGEACGGSNLPHLSAVVDTARMLGTATTGVLRRFSPASGTRIVVDVTASYEGRPVWLKCVARASGGDADALEETARSWLEMAERLPEQGLTPSVSFRFFAGVAPEIAARLAEVGVEDVGEGATPPRPGPERPVTSVNLDTTTLIALVSNLSHGHVGWSFQDAALEHQAEEEASAPVLRQLQEMLAGRRLHSAPIALESFERILSTIAGGKERERARRVMAVVHRLEAPPCTTLASCRRLDKRSREILGVSVKHDMPMATANAKLIRSLADQAAGVRLLQHMPRALTEVKEHGDQATGCARRPALPPQECEALFQQILDSAQSVGEGQPRAVRRQPSQRSDAPAACVQDTDCEVDPEMDDYAGSARPPEADLAIAAALEKLHDERAADDAYRETCAACLAALRDTCKVAFSGPEYRVQPFDWTPDVRLEPFGSTMQGTALRSSDLDVRMWFEQYEVHGQERQLKYLGALQSTATQREGSEFSLVRMVKAQLPVLRLKFHDALEVDITMGRDVEGCTEVDRAFRQAVGNAMDGAALRFVRLVKIFAKSYGLIDTFGGYLNSISWALLVVGFLQGEHCLVPVKTEEEADQNEAMGEPRPRSDASPVASRSAKLTVRLLHRFFRFVECCGRQPQRLAVEWQPDPGCLKPLSRNSRTATIFVQHPRYPDRNLAMALREQQWWRIVGICTAARELLDSSTDQAEVLKLFKGDAAFDVPLQSASARPAWRAPRSGAKRWHQERVRRTDSFKRRRVEKNQ